MIGIIVLNYNTADYTLKCISKIKEATTISYKIYVVDNASKDDSVSVLRQSLEQEKDVEFIISENNGGYSYGNNIGIKKAVQDGCEKLLILNPDVEICKNSVEIMAETLDKDPSIAIVGPKVLTSEGALQDLLINGFSYGEYIKSKQPVKLAYKILTGKYFVKAKKKQYLPEEEQEVSGMVCGCSFMVRSDFFERIGYFDDKVFLYCEEEILFEEVKRAGMKVWYNPAAVVVHKGSVSTGGWMSVFSRRCLSYSRLYFQMKYTKGMKGIKLNFAIFLAKTDFVIVSWKLKQDYKEQYKQLKADIKRLKAEMA